MDSFILYFDFYSTCVLIWFLFGILGLVGLLKLEVSWLNKRLKEYEEEQQQLLIIYPGFEDDTK